jgi:hypothetical protein
MRVQFAFFPVKLHVSSSIPAAQILSGVACTWRKLGGASQAQQTELAWHIRAQLHWSIRLVLR